MTYKNIVTGRFILKKNRFCAEVETGGRVCICHVKNTGRLKELLIRDAVVYLQDHGERLDRKTRYSLVAVEKDGYAVNIDSTSPNAVFGEWVRGGKFVDGVTLVKPETVFGNSRFDYYIEAGDRKIFVEVKGVTLERDGVFLFPDAPTERGIKHLNELCACKKAGYEAYAVFVVQMNRKGVFSPNAVPHPEFAKALASAKECGVNIICVNCNVTPDSIEINERLDTVI